MSIKQITKTQKIGKQSQKDRDFYKGLQQKYINSKSKSNYSSIKQSRNLEKQRQSFKNNKRKNTVKQTKQKENKHKESQKSVKNFLHLPPFDQSSQIQNKIKEQFNFDQFFTNPLQCAQLIRLIVASQRLKFISIYLNTITTPEYPLTFQTKTQSICSYIQPFVRQFQKVTICMYSLSKNSYRSNGKIQFYDMLSIRREVKTDTKLLIQTNICNNSKSNIILKKLFEVAKQRQKIMELQVGISAIVVKLKGILNVVEDKQNNNGENCNKQLQLEISTGGYGEIGARDLMGAQKLRQFFNIYLVNAQQHEQITEMLSQHVPHLKSKRKQQKESQSQLIKKIKSLQSQLNIKKKQLQEQKQRVADQQAIQAELQDNVLASQRPMVNLNIQKYQSRVISVSKNFHSNCGLATIKSKNTF